MQIYVWGTGCGASEAFERGLNIRNVTAFVDSSPINKTFMGLPVLRPSELLGNMPDLILVTTRFADEVEAQCRELGIPMERILYLKDYNLLKDRNDVCTDAEKILGRELLSSLLPRQHLVTEPDSLRDPVLKSRNDYVRLSTLELLSRRVRKIPGALAELGVYKGGFASCMNRLMPERQLYLFDTFSGFDPEEGCREKERHTCQDAFLAAHQNTAAEAVLKIMPNPESVVLKQGYFPKSLNGLEEQFVLVSLDADFRDSTLEGLRYFWPRMVPGGYLLLHDWGCPRLTGVADALEIYQQEIGEKLPGVPIPDIGNSLIIQKVR